MLKKTLIDLYHRHKMFILYAIYGIPPTVIGFLVYWFLISIIGLPAYISNGLAWMTGVVISFFLYRKFVFKSSETGAIKIFFEFLKFVTLRLASGLFETGFILIFVDTLHWHKLIFKIFASFCAAIFNYVVSKIIIFRNKYKYGNPSK